MAYRKTLLAKVIECKESMDEVSAIFKCEPSEVPHWIGIVLQLASDGQKVGFKQASVEQGKTRPFGRPPKAKKKAKVAKKARKSPNYPNKVVATAVKDAEHRPKPHDTILGVMKAFETISVDTMMERIIAKGWQPDSSNFKMYLQNLVSREVRDKMHGRKGAITRVGVNEYRLREWYVKTLHKSTPTKDKKVVPIRPTEASEPATNGAASHG